MKGTVLQVGTAAVGGGAEAVMRSLHEEYLRREIDSWIAVGIPNAAIDPRRTLTIPNDEYRTPFAKALLPTAFRVSEHSRRRGDASWVAGRLLRISAEPTRYARVLSGREDFGFPGTRFLLDLPPRRPNVLHIHNLHGYYFDIRELPRLSAACPTIVTMHDAWLLTGHCAHPFDCPRWETGCGACPDLGMYAPIARDSSAANWRLKHDVVMRSRLRLATPSEWLAGMVQRSGLAEHVIETRVIPNGVDTSVFTPGPMQDARERLGLPTDRTIVLFAARALHENPFKDYRTLLEALPQIAERSSTPLLMVALGADEPAQNVGGAEVRFVPFTPDPEVVADYYRASDVYVHPALAENLPLTVIEAMACGVPVVASSVGGVPEIVVDGETGVLVEVRDAAALAGAVAALLGDHTRSHAYARAGAARVRERFTLERQADSYLSWYEEIQSPS